ncbi:MAG TPA: Gfo/Idh/MocA family oxidoreductase [Acidimicrobiales bacterium]
MSGAPPVRVGFVGTGFIARFHLMMLAGSAQANEVVAVHDADPGRATAFAADTGATVADTVEDLCAQVDAVFVCTWTSAHHTAVATAVAAGRAVFCEKPLAPDLARAEALCALVEGSGVTNQVGLVLRRSPAFTLARRLLADPDAGRIMAVVLRDDQYIPTQGMYGSNWRADPAKAGAGTVIEHSIHDVDLLEWLAGPIEKVSAWTREFHAIDGIEDAATASFSFASGAVGSMVSVWHDVLERPSLRHVEVLCERLHVTVEGDWFGPVRWTLTGQDEQALDGADLLAALDPGLPEGGNPDGEFLAAVAGGRPASPDVREALRAHRVVDALYRSAAADGIPVAP